LLLAYFYSRDVAIKTFMATPTKPVIAGKPIISLQIKGIEEAKQLLSEFSLNPVGNMQTMLTSLGTEMVEQMQGNAPVKTGYLRSHIVSTATNTSLDVTSQAPYSGFVNFGTIHQPPNPYFSTTVDILGRNRFPELFGKDALSNWNKLVSQKTRI
jgi:HK97 gp10 family phage protein